MKIGFYFSFAFRNLFHHKRQMLIIAFGIIMAVSMSLSIELWSETAEDLAINDFLDLQDYQSFISSVQYTEDLPEIEEFINNNPLVELSVTVYATAALFNTENKPSDYQCLPEDGQTDLTNPVSITNAFLADQDTLNRISFLFDVNGNFSIEDNGIVLSWKQAQELSAIYGREVALGDTFNVSIARDDPEPNYGENLISSFNAVNYVNYTVRGIYTFSEGISIVQSALQIIQANWLLDSIVFPLTDIAGSDIAEMVENSILSMLFVKFDKKELSKDGLDHVIEKMEQFSESVKAEFPYSFIFILDAPLIALLNAYSRASIAIVFMVPVTLTGLMLTLFVTNIAVESRREDVTLLRDRGADTMQILLLFLLEFIIISLIGITLGILLAFIIAALIPSVSSSGLSMELFIKFLMNMKVSFSFLIYISVGCLILVISYASFKIWRELAKKESNKIGGQETRRKIERNIFLGLNIFLVASILAALIFSIIDTINEVGGSKNFNLASSTSAGYSFILFCLLLLFVSEGLSLILTKKVLGSIKSFYRRIVFSDTFFLTNNLTRKNKKLSSMSFALIMIASIVVFSVIASESVSSNQNMEADFKNGADLRILTPPIDHTFKMNISKIEGINEAIPILKSKGSIAYDDYTIFGVDPIKYSRIGKWDESCFPENSSYSDLKTLGETYEGVIISKLLADRLELTIGDQVPITNLPGGVYYARFTIVGMINSAPGMGLAEGRNIELSQPYSGFVLINEEYMRNELSVNYCQLFLASVLQGEDSEEITNQLKALFPNVRINPSIINEEFVGAFISSYIPNVLSFLWIELIAAAVIGFVLLTMFTDFTLNQRSQEFAITMSMGASRKNIFKLILTELIVIVLGSSISSILLGVAFTYSSFFIIIPILTSHNIIPFSVVIPFWKLAIFPIIMTFAALIGTFPSIIKHSRKEIIEALRN